MKICRICQSETSAIFKARILNKYDVAFYLCATCGFLQTEEPFWLDEAYQSTITASDTGGLLRSLVFADICSILIFFLFDRNARFLDYAGGYGIFTRRMRDIGFDFYWQDKYSANLLARGFEHEESSSKYEAVTTFESFEHFRDPLREIETMLSFSENIIFATDTLPVPVPKPEEWYYYSLHHGQHISFYSHRTLKYIANKYKVNFYSFGTLHIFTTKRIHPVFIEMLITLKRLGLSLFVRRVMKSRTVADSNYLAQLKRRSD